MRVGKLARNLAAAALVTSLLAVEPHATPAAYGQAATLSVCGVDAAGATIDIGEPGAGGWSNEQEKLANASDAKRYVFKVKEKGTAFVYVGDQWYNLNLGLFSVTDKQEACWTVDGRGTSTQSERRDLQFIRPDERAIEVMPGEYMLTARAGDGAAVDPSRAFTVRVAVTPGLCSLLPQNEPTEYQGMTKKPDNPDKFQIGVSVTPDETQRGPNALMAFNAFTSPPYTDLFDFTWEIDGKVVPDETGPTLLKPYADLPKMPLGLHTVKLTAKGAREYKDPTESVYNFTPFNGESRTVVCQFRGQA